MVRAYFPQRANRNIDVNTNNPPQGVPVGDGPATAGSLVQTGGTVALVQTGTLTALVQTGTV